MKTIIITGSVCSGKTSIAKEIAKEKNYTYIDINYLIKKHKLYDYYDKKLKTYIVDITKCNIKELKKRLEKRKYSKQKIRENLDAEILDVCLIEALNNKHKVKVIDTTKGFNQNKLNIKKI